MLKKILLISLISLTYQVAYSFDRAAIHDERLGDFSKTERQLQQNTKYQQVSLSTSDDDLVISESVSPARFKQDEVCLSALSDNSWVAIWNDNRLGADKLFVKHLDSLGNSDGIDQLLISSTIGTDLVDPKIATDASGRIYVFYRDRTNGLVMGSRFNDDWTVDVEPFLVNDTSFDSFAGIFDFAVYPDGKMVVVWENYSGIATTIEMKIISSDIHTIVGPATVNSGGGSDFRICPSVAVDPSGNFLVAWEDYRNGQPDIYARLFNGAGVAQGDDFGIVAPPESLADQYTPVVVFSASDQFVIGWIDTRSGQQAYIQQYSAATGFVGVNQNISGTDANKLVWNLSLAVSYDDRLMAQWASFGPQNNILRLHFDIGLSPSGLPTTVNASSTGQRWKPAAAFNENFRHGISWIELQDYDADINFMLFDSSDVGLLGDELILNDDSAGAPSIDPVIVSTVTNGNVIVFTDERSDAGDIYLQAITNSGTLVGMNTRLNQDPAGSLQAEPSVAISTDSLLIVWLDTRDVGAIPGKRLFGRFTTLEGVPVGDEFLISQNGSQTVSGTPAVIINIDGKILVAWIDNRHSTDNMQIYGQWLTPAGGIDGDEFAISDILTDTNCVDLHLGTDLVGKFYAVWRNIGQDKAIIRGRWFESNGSPGGDFSLFSPIPGIDIDELSSVVDDNGNIALAWVGTNGNRILYFTLIDNSGTLISEIIEITDHVNAYPTDPALAVANDGYVSMTWVDRRLGYRSVYKQLLNEDLLKAQENQVVSSANPEFMLYPATCALDGRAWFVWADPRTDGLNIYANSMVYTSTGIDTDSRDNLPARFVLKQNFPNPFNPETEISFVIPKTSHVKLEILNILGQQVRVLVDDVLTAGEHSVTWDGDDSSGDQAASGVYFYRVETGGDTQSRKMMLLK